MSKKIPGSWVSYFPGPDHLKTPVSHANLDPDLNVKAYDVIVAGLGGMGSATACALARRGKRVLGLERFTPVHDRGSSHGATRVIRQAYYEDPSYVPLLLRAYELWRELEEVSGRSLLVETGGLMIGDPTSGVVTGSLRSAREHGLPYELLDASQLRRRFSPLTPGKETVALWEERAGFLWAEHAVQAHLDVATGNGAVLRFEEPVEEWSATDSRVNVRTSRGDYEAESLVITPGPWAPEVLDLPGVPLAVERQVLYWFEPSCGIDSFHPARFPVYVWEEEGGATPYGFPALDDVSGGVKVAFYRAPDIELCTPETIDRQIRDREVKRLRDAMRDRIPSLCGRLIRAETCMYTNTPDHHFVISVLPEAPRVSVACGFSGHGFKFCSVVGEIMADLATGGTSTHNLHLFRPGRF